MSTGLAPRVDAGTIRALARAALVTHGPMTADECADWLELDPLAVRPRFSELQDAGVIEKTLERRVNQVSGKRATVWRIKEGR